MLKAVRLINSTNTYLCYNYVTISMLCKIQSKIFHVGYVYIAGGGKM